MKTSHRLLLLIDRLAETVRTVQERIRHAVATEIGQAVGQSAQDLLHVLLRGSRPRFETVEPNRGVFEGGEDFVEPGPDDSEGDRSPAVAEFDRPSPPPNASSPSRVPWIGLGLGLIAGLATWWSPPATAGFLAVAADKMARTPNTFDAHRLVWLAGERGVQDGVVEALFKAYFSDGRDLSDRAILAAVAVEGGLDAGAVDSLLSGDEGRAAVQDAEERGRRLGITGVPFVVIDGEVALSGAQPPEMFRSAIEQARAAQPIDACELHPASGERKC